MLYMVAKTCKIPTCVQKRVLGFKTHELCREENGFVLTKENSGLALNPSFLAKQQIPASYQSLDIDGTTMKELLGKLDTTKRDYDVAQELSEKLGNQCPNFQKFLK